MAEYKYTRHMWTKDDDFLLHAERTMAYMEYYRTTTITARPLCSAEEQSEYETLETVTEKFTYLLGKLMDRSRILLPNVYEEFPQGFLGMGCKAMEAENLARLIWIFNKGLYLNYIGSVSRRYNGTNKKFISMDGPVSTFLHPRAYTLDGMSTTMHSQVFRGGSLEFVPWVGDVESARTTDCVWLVTGFHFEFFTLIAELFKSCTFSSPI